MSVFKTEGVVLKIGKLSEQELYYKVFFRDYGVLTVKKKKKTREKPIDIGYFIQCEIITHRQRNIHTIGNIKIKSFFDSNAKLYQEIELFLRLLGKVKSELPEGSPHYEVYDILSHCICLEKDISFHRLLLTHLKLIQCLGNLPDSHNNLLIQKTLQYIHVHSYGDIMKLGKIPNTILKELEDML